MRHSHCEPSCQCLWDWPLTQWRQQPPSTRATAAVAKELKCCGWEIGSGSDTAARRFNHTPAGTYLRREWATGGSSTVSARHEYWVCHRWRVWVTLCVFHNVLSQQSAFFATVLFFEFMSLSQQIVVQARLENYIGETGASCHFNKYFSAFFILCKLVSAKSTKWSTKLSIQHFHHY